MTDVLTNHQPQAMSRWQAGAIHFGISLTIFLLALGIIILVWYPGILFRIDGGWTGLQIIIAVDLVLGPLLTLVVFRAGKPGLKFDLSVIATLQIVCLAAGLWIVYSERPLALVLAYDTIYSVTADEFEDYERDVAVLESMPGPYPKLLYTELPANDVSAEIAAIRSQFIGDPLFIQTERYAPIPAQDPAAVFRREAVTRGELTEDIAAALPETCLLAKFVSAVTSGFVCLDRESLRLDEFYPAETATRQAGSGDDGSSV